MVLAVLPRGPGHAPRAFGPLPELLTPRRNQLTTKSVFGQTPLFRTVTERFFDEPGSQIVTKARSTAPANQEPPNGTSSGLPSRTDNNSGLSASGSLAARLANAPRGYGGFSTM